VNYTADRYFIVVIKLQILNISTLEKYDSKKMYKVYDNWPKIARESFESEQECKDFENIQHIVFAGMGGSGAIGDMFASILSKTKIHVNVVKGYVLPNTVNSNTLVVIVSVSGNTIETLSILKSAKNLGCKIIAFSSGGLIQEYCSKHNLNHRVIPMNHSPRATFPSYLYSILKVLHQTLNIKKENILESINELENINKKINSSNLTNGNTSLDLAKWITSIPIIYYPFGLQSAAIRFKNSLQENSKTHAIAEDVIEACHNGIISWEKKSNVLPILIRGIEDNIKTKERWEILKEYFDENKIEYIEIVTIEGNILSKLINLIYLLDYATIYKAILDNTDPSPVKSIDFIKSKLQNI
jgi:glucose/mannose-6-phosphate isomerase